MKPTMPRHRIVESVQRRDEALRTVHQWPGFIGCFAVGRLRGFLLQQDFNHSSSFNPEQSRNRIGVRKMTQIPA
jgi:hypothetical protein